MFGIGRPLRRILVGVRAGGELPGCAAAVLRSHPDLVLARLIAHERDPSAIRRPGGAALVDAGRLGEIAGRPVLGRHGEDVAARPDDRAGAIRCDVVGGDLLAHILDAAAADGEVLLDFDGNFLGLLRGQVEAVNEPAILEHDRGVAERGKLDRELGEMGELAGLLCAQVVGEKVGLPVGIALGHEVNLVAPPHGEDVLRRVVGEPRGRFCGKIIKPDLVRLPAPIALPSSELTEDTVVSHLLSVRRKAAPTTAGEGQRLGNAALQPRQGEFALERVPLRAPGSVNDGVVVTPGHDDVVGPHPVGDIVALERGGVGEAPGFAAVCGHDIDLGVAVVLSGEGKEFSIGREAREHFVASFIAGQASRETPVSRNRVEITGAAEHDLLPVNRGEAEQSGLGGTGHQGRRGEEGGQAPDSEQMERTWASYHAPFIGGESLNSSLSKGIARAGCRTELWRFSEFSMSAARITSSSARICDV